MVVNAVSGLLSEPRMRDYKLCCDGDELRALDLYVWNMQVSAAFGETIGFLEVALRNTLAGRMHARHVRKRRSGSWLDDPAGELAPRARADIAEARRRVLGKRKPLTADQVITELNFGFWRFLLANQYRTTLWPDLLRGFAHIPGSDQRSALDGRVRRLHDLRNRLAHHEPVWNKPLEDRARDARDVLGYLDPVAASWWNDRHCRIEALLDACPVVRPRA
ncbi:Abi family protein [Saccharothrix longispora]